MNPVGSFTVPPDHPSLPGHFPGNPIVPGVVLLAELLALLGAAFPGRRIRGLPAVKFLLPVLPGQAVAVLCRPGADNRVVFGGMVAGQDVLRGTVLLDGAG